MIHNSELINGESPALIGWRLAVVDTCQIAAHRFNGNGSSSPIDLPLTLSTAVRKKTGGRNPRDMLTEKLQKAQNFVTSSGECAVAQLQFAAVDCAASPDNTTHLVSGRSVSLFDIDRPTSSASFGERAMNGGDLASDSSLHDLSDMTLNNSTNSLGAPLAHHDLNHTAKVNGRKSTSMNNGSESTASSAQPNRGQQVSIAFLSPISA